VLPDKETVSSVAMRLRMPQPYEDLAHTADVGVRVRGATAEEALGRLVVAFSTLATGGVTADPTRDERVAVTGGPELAGTAVALLRELLFRLATAHELPIEIEVERVDEAGAVATVTFGKHDPQRHAEGADVKAVTWHAARLEREGDGWVAQCIFDI
jgi:SHS2 domain-containing protein